MLFRVNDEISFDLPAGLFAVNAEDEEGSIRTVICDSPIDLSQVPAGEMPKLEQIDTDKGITVTYEFREELEGHITGEWIDVAKNAVNGIIQNGDLYGKSMSFWMRKRMPHL